MTEPEENGLPRVSVVVPTYRRRDLVRNCLQSLLAQDFPSNRYEIIVVEDGSDDAGEVVRSISNGHVAIRYFQTPHRGHASTYDLGFKEARYEIVAFIDDDAKAPANWLRRMVSTLVNTRDQGVGGVGGRISADYPVSELEARATRRGDLIWSGYDAVVPGLQRVDFLPGANMAFWRKALIEAGGFDTAFSRRISWRHETDLAFRVQSRGHRLVFDSDLVVSHRAARWADLIERVRPVVVWAMARDDAYFRAKNYGWQGVAGAAIAAAKGARTRIVLGMMNLFLVFVQIIAWIPGAAHGLLRKHRDLAILKAKP
jgi:glycosyltransferase involved in cell wall biosynthesis